MTKEEFIQKAALIILEKHNGEFLGIDVVVGYSKELADAVYGEEKKSEEDDEKFSSTSYDDELISNVINEIDRIDEEDVTKRRKEAFMKKALPGIILRRKVMRSDLKARSSILR